MGFKLNTEIPPLDFKNIPKESYHDYFIKETSERNYIEKSNIHTIDIKDLSMQESAVSEYKLFENIIKKNNDCKRTFIIVISFGFIILVTIVVVFLIFFFK